MRLLLWSILFHRSFISYHLDQQASLPLVEPVAVVEAAIDDLIEDRVALERLEEVGHDDCGDGDDNDGDGDSPCKHAPDYYDWNWFK